MIGMARTTAVAVGAVVIVEIPVSVTIAITTAMLAVLRALE